MNRFAQNMKCVMFCLLSLSLGAVTAVGETKANSSKPKLPEILMPQGRAFAAAENKLALKAYENRDFEVARWAEDEAPPNPDNAALLYYQAFLLRPDPNVTIARKIRDVLFDAKADKQLRTYLGHCLPMIEVLETASGVPQCTWGLSSQSGFGFGAKDLRDEVSMVGDILAVDARTLAADGHYRTALERCLTLRRLARHLDRNSDLVLTSRAPDITALRTVRYVLGVVPPDHDILLWFRGQLAVAQGVRLSFAETIKADFRSFLHRMRTNPVRLSYLRNLLMKEAKDKEARDVARNLTDGQLMARLHKPFPNFFDSIFRIADSGMTYEQKLAQMQSLVNELIEAHDADPLLEYAVYFSGVEAMIDLVYPSQVGHEAHINGIKAAVEVYLVVAETGKLPEKLPAHLPKDPFTGKDFGYEITDGGFALRCEGKEFKVRKKSLLEFRVRR